MPYLIGLGLTFGLFAAYVATRPGQFRITRELVIDAPPEVLFALINDFHAWVEWSPWEKVDADLKKTYEGPDSGVGAVYRWQGKKTGEGDMKITRSEPASRIEIDLNFIKPFAANNKTVFTLEPEGKSTTVRWAMDGTSNFVSKAFGVFVNMDKMVGKDFENGLAAMNEAAAKRA